MAKTTKNFSLRDELTDSIGNFLVDEKFTHVAKLRSGILEVVNLIADYREEDTPLFPEVLITTSPETLKSIPSSTIEIAKGREMTQREFARAIKLCAPLAVHGWNIFLEVNRGKLRYGVVNAEISETSPTLYTQTVGQMADVGPTARPIALIRNIGAKTVEVIGNQRRLEISLTLASPEDRTFSEIKDLCDSITINCTEPMKTPLSVFLEKSIDEALKTGHGNLIGVIANSDEALIELKMKLDEKGGVYLLSPIDLAQLVENNEVVKDSLSATNLKIHASILKTMLGHDGITIFSNDGKILGYHLLIGEHKLEGDEVDGGARSKAFTSMKNCGAFTTCFFKSQDGRMKLWHK